MTISRPIFFLAVFISGWCALTYQVCWERLFIVNFGVDFYSVSAITTAFLTGLGLGALFLGRYVDRHPNPLKVYGYLELFIGLYGIASVAIIRALYPLSLALQQRIDNIWLYFLCAFLMVFIIMLPPTIMMGGTLPVMVKYFLRKQRDAGRTVGVLYAVNTFGSVIGAFMGAFITISLLQVDGSIYVAGLLNIVIGVVFLLRARKAKAAAHATATASPVETSAPQPLAPAFSPFTRSSLLLLYLVSSAVALGWEILWFRMVSLRWQNATGGFGLVLTLYLLGIVIGSGVFAMISHRFRETGIRLFASLQFLTAAVCVAGFLFYRWTYHHMNVPAEAFLLEVYERLSGVENRFDLGGSLTGSGLRIFIAFAALITVPMIVQGMCFPLIARLCTSSYERAGKSIGSVYFVSIVGSFIGASGMGYLALPWLGLRGSLLLLIALSVIAGLAAWALSQTHERQATWRARLLTPSVEALCAGAALIIFLSLPANIHAWLSGRAITTLREGVTGIAYIHGDETYQAVNINGQNHGGLQPFMFQRDDLKIAIAVNLNPSPKTAVLIGLGNARTLAALEKYEEIERIDVVEISRELIPALLAQDDIPWVHEALQSPKVNLIYDDGRAFLNKTEQRYDIIASAPIFAYNAYGGYLYSREMLELVRSRLNPSGIFVLLNDSLVPTMRFIQMRTFASVFPHFILDSGNYLHGSPDPIAVDFARIERSYALNQHWLTTNGMGFVAPNQRFGSLNMLAEKGAFLTHLRSDENAFDDLEGFPIATDLSPRTEFWLLQHDPRAADLAPPLNRRTLAYHMPTNAHGELMRLAIPIPRPGMWSINVIGGDRTRLRAEPKDDGSLVVSIGGSVAQPINIKIHTGASHVLDPPGEADGALAAKLKDAGDVVLGVRASGRGVLELQYRTWSEAERRWRIAATRRFTVAPHGDEYHLAISPTADSTGARLSFSFESACEIQIDTAAMYHSAK